MKKLSVLIPILRIDTFLTSTLLSLDAQTYRNFKAILICDSSLEKKLNILLKHLKVKFKYKIIHTKLKGVAFAANLGIAETDTEYLARWDADDLCDPNRFKEQIKELDLDRSLGVIGTKVELIDEFDNIIKFHKFKFYKDNLSIRRALKYRQPLLHSSLIFRTEVLFKNNGYLYGHTSEDHELYLRIARDSLIKFKNLETVKTYYRRHSNQLSDIKNQQKAFYEISGFMITEFLMTFNPLYIIGMFANVPFLRRLRHKWRNFLKFLFKIC
jgi:glycosyltransferase involved in cell wall biosynthesis